MTFSTPFWSRPRKSSSSEMLIPKTLHSPRCICASIIFTLSSSGCQPALVLAYSTPIHGRDGEGFSSSDYFIDCNKFVFRMGLMQTAGAVDYRRNIRVIKKRGVTDRAKSLYVAVPDTRPFLRDRVVSIEHCVNQRMIGIYARRRPIHVPLDLRRIFPKPRI